MRLPGMAHITDGAPRSPADARRAGYPIREAYAAARRLELLCALRTRLPHLSTGARTFTVSGTIEWKK